jgi:two-component system, NarL family, response regulator NreC
MTPSLRLVSGSDGDGVHQENGRIRVVLADDHEAVRRSLRQVLDSEENIEVIAEAQDLDSLMRVIGVQPAVLALDPSLLGTPRLETLRRAHIHAPNTEIVVLSMTDDANLAQQTLDAGATGFVLKDMAAEELPTAIHSAAAGERYVSPRIAARLAQLPE